MRTKKLQAEKVGRELLTLFQLYLSAVCSPQPATTQNSLCVKAQQQLPTNPTESRLCGSGCVAVAVLRAMACWFISPVTQEPAHPGCCAMPGSLARLACLRLKALCTPTDPPCLSYRQILSMVSGTINPGELHGKKLFNQKPQKHLVKLNHCSHVNVSLKFPGTIQHSVHFFTLSLYES